MGLQEGLWCDAGPETQGGSLAVRRHHQAICLLCILGMVAWFSDGQYQEETKQVQRLACLRITRAMRATPTNEVEALICLPLLELVVQSEARSAAHRLGSVGCWSYLRPNRGHSSGFNSRIPFLTWLML